jgi:hypothetical protein
VERVEVRAFGVFVQELVHLLRSEGACKDDPAQQTIDRLSVIGDSCASAQNSSRCERFSAVCEDLQACQQ